MSADVKYPHITVELDYEDGNAHAVLAQARKALRRAGVDADEIEAFSKDALSADYDHVFNTIFKTMNVV